MSVETRDIIMLGISLSTAALSVYLYVLSVLHQAWRACWLLGITLFVFGVFAVVMLARVLHEAA
jgi:uncharacterized membrane protein